MHRRFKLFDGICGNEFAKKMLSSMICHNQLVHTILLSGEEGLGKRTFAKEIAKQIVWQNASQDFVQKSIENCVDVNIIDGNISGTIVIGSIRELKEKINVAPHEAEKKVQIIANCDKMTIAAQNALLKSLEEPSETTVFILTASNKHKLLDTILSRAVIVEMEKVSDQEAIDFLVNKYLAVSDFEAKKQDITELVKIFGGNLGLIQTVLESENFENSENYYDRLEKFLLGIVSNSQYDVMKILSEYKSNKTDLVNFLELFKIYFYKILKVCLKNQGENQNNNYIQKFFLNSKPEEYLYIFDVINKATDYLSSNLNLNLTLTWLNINLFNKYI